MPGVDYFLALLNNNGIARYWISDQDWEALQDVELVLSVSHKLVGDNAYILISNNVGRFCIEYSKLCLLRAH